MGNLQIFVLVILHLFAFYADCCGFNNDGDSRDSLQRRKRYIIFPEGSTFSVAFSSRWKSLTPDNILIFGMNWAVSFDLQNHTLRNPNTNRIVPPFNIRRRRRELYLRLEAAMNSAGINGRTCIKRALCEAGKRPKPKTGIVDEILNLIFSFPLDLVELYEPIEHHDYDAAYRKGLSQRNCQNLYKLCPISLLDTLFKL